MNARVLHVFSTFAPGGPQVRTVRLLGDLDPGWRHWILALDGRTEARELIPPDAPVEILEAPRRSGTPRTALALVRILRRLRPDLLLTYNWGAVDALLASRLARPPGVIHHEDGFRPDEVAGFKRRRILLRRHLLPGTDGLIVPSFRLEAIAREVWRLPVSLVHRIPNGIRLEGFSRADGNPARRAELGIPAGAVVIGSVGHLRAEKNPVRLVEALATLPPHVHLLILGEGPERTAVLEALLARGLAGRGHLVGHRAHPQDDYRAMDVFALSSDTEQMPMALLEAMACSLAVAATDVGDVGRILPAEQAPFVVPVSGQAAAALAQALARLIEAPELRARLGAANRAQVEREHSFETMARAYRACYERPLQRGRP